MKIVMVERNSVGLDVQVDSYKQLGDVTYYPHTTAEEAAKNIGEADVVISNKLQLNETTLKDCPNVKLICNTATGFDNIDLEYCNKRGIRVTNVKDYSTAAVAQHTFAMLFYLLESLAYYDQYVKSGSYINDTIFSHFSTSFHELHGMTWGIIGLGAIGRRVAEIATAFGCNVQYYSTSGKNSNSQYKRVELDELLSTSDIVSIHAPLNEQTEGLINKEALAKMKKSAILLNVGRGPIIVEEDLAKALQNETIKAAGLDVLCAEPMSENNPLFEIKDSTKLFISPHMAWASLEARARLMQTIFEQVRDFFA